MTTSSRISPHVAEGDHDDSPGEAVGLCPVGMAAKVSATTRLRGIAFWVILCTFVAGFVCLCFYFPYRQERLYRAIPPSAVFISEHAAVAGRCRTLLASPLAGPLLSACGVKGRDLERILKGRVVERVARRFAARNTVVAYVPALGLQGEPAWVFASWCGSAGQFLRMGVYNRYLRDLKRVKLPGRRKAWLLAGRGLPSDRRLSLAVVEGVLLGCYSRDPLSIEQLLVRVEGRAPIGSELLGRLAAGETETATTDRVWLPGGDFSGPGRAVTGDFEARDAVGVKGAFDLPVGVLSPLVGRKLTGPIPPGRKLGEGNAVFEPTEMATLIGDAAATIVVAPFGELVPLLAGPGAHKEARFAGDILRRNVSRETPAFICLCRVDYSGRILGFKTPTLMAGVELQNPAALGSMLESALDGLNARNGWSLMPTTTMVGGQSMVTIEGAREGFYAQLGDGEHPACAVLGRWLVFSSNANALQQIIRRGWQPVGESVQPGWVEPLSAGTGRAFLWVDLEATQKALMRAVAVYDLMSYARSSERSSGPFRQGLETTQHTIELLCPMQTARLWLDTTDSGLTGRFCLGRCD